LSSQKYILKVKVLKEQAMATMNISLPDSMKEFVETEVHEGGYTTTSEYFRALVREAQDRKSKARLEVLLLEGIQSGAATPLTDTDWREIQQEVRTRATRRSEQKSGGE
jgi:antitoxin ParD1/3/4